VSCSNELLCRHESQQQQQKQTADDAAYSVRAPERSSKNDIC
jgi:hypothetical protein